MVSHIVKCGVAHLQAVTPALRLQPFPFTNVYNGLIDPFIGDLPFGIYEGYAVSSAPEVTKSLYTSPHTGADYVVLNWHDVFSVHHGFTLDFSGD